MEVKLWISSHKIFTLSVDKADTVESLKAKVQDTEGTPAD